MIIVIISLLVLIGIWAVVIFNRFIRWKNLVKEGWSGIDVQLKRRHDLVPNLVRIVQEYSGYEERVLIEITRARSECLTVSDPVAQAGPENALSRGLKSLLAVAENYPRLKADRQFLALQENLVEIEGQIQLARRYYNGTVRNYNILVESFPGLLMAKILGLRPGLYFEIETATERKPINIEV
jgi:LemA protein